MEDIDSLPVSGVKLSRLKKMKESLEGISDKNSATEERYEKVLEAMELAEILESSGKGMIVEDQSPNRYTMEFPAAGEAVLQRYKGITGFKGKADVTGEGADENFRRLFSGNHSFTIEAVVNPRDTGYYNSAEPNDAANYNVIASKGDECAGLRISEKSVQFFIRNDSEKWINAKLDLSEEQLDSWIHVAGIYDGESIAVYLEGMGMHTILNAGTVAGSDYPLSIGYCPETGRTSTCSIAEFRVYSRALTEEELNGGTVAPNDEAAVLWYDFNDYQCPAADLSPIGIRSCTTSIQIEKGERSRILAEPVPFYAKGSIGYDTDAPETASVSEDGSVEGRAKGTANITAGIDNTDFTVTIPVQVGPRTFTPAGILEWTAQRMLLLDAVIFLAVLLFLFYTQQKRLVSCTAEAFEAVGRIGTEEELNLRQMPYEAQVVFGEAEERFRQKDSKAKEAEQRKSDLIAYLAHDLKTPLASVIGYLTLLKNGKQLPSGLYQHYVEIALGSSQHLNDLIDEFFEISRFNMAHMEIEYREINLSWLLEQLVSEFEPLFAEKGLSCKKEVPGNLHLRCDPDKLERVFNNLLRNAINYSYPNTEIVIRVEAAEQMVFTCENCGDTISREKLERIFEQFYRLDAASSSETGGTGLGLAIAKNIVELHKGEIHAQSQKNRTRFTVILPWRQEEGML